MQIYELRLSKGNASLYDDDLVRDVLRDQDVLIGVTAKPGQTSPVSSQGNPKETSSTSDQTYPQERQNQISGAPEHTSTSATAVSSGLDSGRTFSSPKDLNTSFGFSDRSMIGDLGSPEKKFWYTSLRHNGPLFPPAYVAHGIKLKYDGQQIDLPVEVEEIATCFAVYLDTPHTQKPTFRRNFFQDFCKILRKSGYTGPSIDQLDLCDFSDIQSHLQRQKEKRLNRSSEEKQTERQNKELLKEVYGYAEIDGRREAIANFQIEPPGLFLGRGEHPMAGRWKRRIMPEDVTLNLDKNAPIPDCPLPGHSWGRICHNKNVAWIATWKDSIMDLNKFILFSASSSVYAISVRDKFELARKLKTQLDSIRSTYEKDLSSPLLSTQQCATVVWMIDRLALRVGYEKTDEQSDAVGCCFLRVEHLRLKPQSTVELDFLGADSLRYLDSAQVPEQIFHNLSNFIGSKSPKDSIFDLISSSDVNKYLQALFRGLTAKLFRICNASMTLQNELSKIHNIDTMTEEEKVLAFNKANRSVAMLCSHTRSSSTIDHTLSTISSQLEKLEEKKNSLFDSSNESRDAQLAQVEAKMAQLNTKKLSAIELSGVVLTTSKINYIDPRITIAWCKKQHLDLSRIYPRTLRDKFSWAIEEIERDPNFQF